MCRTGGRRCPSSVPQSKEALDAKNLKRRLDYAVTQYMKTQVERDAARSAVVADHSEENSKTYNDMLRRLDVASHKRNAKAVEWMKHKLTAEQEHVQERQQVNTPSPKELGFPENAFHDGREVDELEQAAEDSMWNELVSKAKTYETDSLLAYTGEWAFLVNYQLRRGILHKDDTPEEATLRSDWYATQSGGDNPPTKRYEDWQDQALRIAADVDDIIETHSESREPRVMWRGVKGDISEVLREAEVGSTVDFPSFSSAARVANESYHFAVTAGKGGREPYIVMELLTQKGLDVGSGGDWNETETILPRNTSWRVAGSYESKQVHRGVPVTFMVVQLVDEDHLATFTKGTAKT